MPSRRVRLRRLSAAVQRALVRVGSYTRSRYRQVRSSVVRGRTRAVQLVRHRWSRISLVLTVSVTIVGLVADTLGISSGLRDIVTNNRDGKPVKLSGDVNILVIEFWDDGGHGSSFGNSLREALVERLEDSTVNVQVGYEAVAIPPAAPDLRAASLRASATRTMADLVLTARVSVEQGRTVVATEMFANETKLLDAPEVAGYTQLPKLVEVGSWHMNAATRSAIRAQLATTASGWVSLVFALAAYERTEYVAAQANLAMAQRHFAALPPSYGFILEMLLANVAGKQRQFAVARKHYLAAQDLNPTSPRPAIGFASLSYQGGHGRCTGSTVRRHQLEDAIARYMHIRTMTADDTASRIKAEFGLGQVHLCLAQAGAGESAERAAASAFEKVVSEADGRNEVPQQLVAEAHAGLGLLALSSRRTDADIETLRKALSEYGAAVENSLDPARTALFLALRAYIHGELGDPRSACDELAHAKSVNPKRSGEVERQAGGTLECGR